MSRHLVAATSFEHLNQILIHRRVVISVVECARNVDKIVGTCICKVKTTSLALAQQMDSGSFVQILESRQIIGTIIVGRVGSVNVLSVDNELLA